MLKAVVFDVDNTLVNFMRMKRHAVDAAVEAMIDPGLKGTLQEVVDKIFKVYWREGIEDQQIFNKVLMEELGHIDYRVLAAGIVGYRRAKDAYLSVYPRVHSTMKELVRMGIKIGVASDAPILQVWMRLVALDLSHYFDAVVTSEEVGEKKPSPKPFRLILERLGVQPQEAMMVGDWADRDIVGAKGVGMHTAFARYGDEFKTQASGADHDLGDIGELLAIIRGANGKAVR